MRRVDQPMVRRSAVSSSSTVALWVVAVVLILFFLRSARPLFIPITLAVLISYALAPAVTWLERRKVHRLAGAGLVMLLTLGVCGGGGYVLKDDARALARSVPDAMDRGRALVRSQLGVEVSGIQEAVDGSGPREAPSETVADTPAGGTSERMATALVQQIIGVMFSFAGHLVVVFFLIYFLLISGHHVRNRLVEIAGPDPERQRMTSTIIDDVNAQIQRYLLVLLITAIAVGGVTWLVLAWMGVQHAAMWGILAGVFNSIPYFGPVIVGGGLFVVGMVQGGGITQALQMSGAAIVITSLEGWLLTPLLMGKAERMSALAVFLGLLLWTWVWGAWGTVLAVPMLVVIKSVADHVERLRPLGRLMAP
jgi:predicted PurR-regulated permease PerM